MINSLPSKFYTAPKSSMKSMKSMHRILHIGLFCSLLLGVGCDDTNQQNMNMQHTLSQSWVLFQVEGNASIESPEAPITLEIKDDSSFAGSGGCNSYFGTLKTSDEGTLEFGPIGSTRMMCQGTVSDIESHYFQLLERVENSRIEGDKLFLLSKEDQPLLAFKLTEEGL